MKGEDALSERGSRDLQATWERVGGCAVEESEL